MRFPREEARQLIQLALDEDVGSGDVTTNSIIDTGIQASGLMRARESMIVSGGPLVTFLFEEWATGCRVDVLKMECDRAWPGENLLRISGSARSLLTLERVALNFLQRLSGIATLTARFCREIEGTGVKLLDTRKTTPAWRALEKYAVQCGGGTNHRMGLYDLVMIKDNHLMALQGMADNPIALAVERARQQHPTLRIEVEADNLEQVQCAIEAGADIVLLDNMNLDNLRLAVSMCRHKVQTEASGGITLESIRQVAETGVDFISVGALTHSARNVDIGLDFQLDE
ncbi:MAG: carboxylating nicotinate-nucleotide diphosphorylase [Verrucomicrobia bacterium]|nr:carboxylating nicotinate-nucleotide diphosphorylase [Verrucomicrobiota bacterium]